MEVDSSNIQKCFTLIEYPGIVKNVDNMLNTLGGIVEISKVCSKKNRRLELRFRPDDVFCKPACGDKYETDGIVLKIKSIKIKNDDGEYVPVVTGCSVAGRVSTAFKFKSICDFQYLPMLTDDQDKLVNICDTVLPSEVDGDKLKVWFESPAKLYLPPAAFSRIDTQSLNSYMFRRDTKDKKDEAPGPLIGRTRKRRSGHAVFVSFSIPKIPTKPRDKAIKFLDVKFLNGEPLEKVRQCFVERPVWSKLALMCVTGYGHDQLKYLLPAVSYYFVTGPFRVMWVRFGYDPRKDPNSRIYQTLDYRIRAPGGLLNLVKAKRGYANYLLPSKANHSMAKQVVIKKDVEEAGEEDASSESVKLDSYIYEPSRVPPARQMFYQYCDVKVPEIESMLGRLPKVPQSASCHPKHGWLPPGFDNQCRDIINCYVMNVLTEMAVAKGSAPAKGEDEDEVAPDDSSDNEEQWDEEFDDEDVDNSEEEKATTI